MVSSALKEPRCHGSGAGAALNARLASARGEVAAGLIRFLHAADVHLDSPLRGLERYEGAPVEEMRGATRRALAALVDLALAEEVAFVLLAGDLYDGDWKDYNTGLFFVSQMGRLAEAGIRVFVVRGNHDAASQITRSLRPPGNVHVFPSGRAATVLLAGEEVAIHGRSFGTPAEMEDLSAGYPRPEPHLFNIGLLHTGLEGRPGHARYSPCTVDGLRSRGYQYWALGHIHAREELCQDPWILFPGNLQGRHVRETGAKGATLVTVEHREVVDAEHRELDVLRWAVCGVETEGATTPEEVVDRAAHALAREVERAGGRPVAARVKLGGGSCPAHPALAADPERWLQEIRAAAERVRGSVWVADLVVGPRLPAGLTPVPSTLPARQPEGTGRDDALGRLLARLSELEAGGDLWEGVAPDFAELARKLPPELRGEEGEGEVEARSRLSAEVRDLLLSRLLPAGEAPRA